MEKTFDPYDKLPNIRVHFHGRPDYGLLREQNPYCLEIEKCEYTFTGNFLIVYSKIKKYVFKLEEVNFIEYPVSQK